MVNLSKMKKSELVEYCKGLQFQNDEIQKLLNHDIIKDNKLLQKENETLKKDYEILEDSYKYELGDNAELSKEYKQLEEEIEKLKKENEKFNNKWYKDLSIDNKLLQEENEKLLKKINIPQEEIRKVIDLEEKIGELELRLKEDHNNQLLHKRLIEENEKLKKENEEITNKYTEGYDLLCGAQTSMEEMLLKIEELKEENEKLKKENENLNKELEYYKNFKSKFNDFVKGHEISSSWGKQYTP